MELEAKLAILADAAKYDASCASSGSEGRRAAAGTGSVGALGRLRGAVTVGAVVR